MVIGIGIVGYRPVGLDSLSAPVTMAVENGLQDIAQSAPARMAAEASAVARTAITATPVVTTRIAELDDGQTFAELLMDQGVPSADAMAAMNALAKSHDLRRMKAGQDVALTFLTTGQQETLTRAVFQPEDTKEITVLRADDGAFTAKLDAIPVVHQRFAARAEIRSSLYEAGDKAKVPHAVMAAFIRTYSHDVDFQRDIQPGDSFEILYDQSITAKGKPVGEGTIVYASLHVNGKDKPIYRVTFADNSTDYFDASGRSIRRALLRTPVAAARITSSFGMRMHPLLGYSKMHKGVDFGAPMGAPIFAAGNGVIADIGFKNGYGRYIRIAHNGTLATAYAHMSRFNADLYRGARVTQGQVIGYVGMSGRATGPHLHFEVLSNGQQVNPMSVSMPTGRVLDAKLLAVFKQGQARIRNDYEALLVKGDGAAASRVIQN